MCSLCRPDSYNWRQKVLAVIFVANETCPDFWTPSFSLVIGVASSRESRRRQLRPREWTAQNPEIPATLSTLNLLPCSPHLLGHTWSLSVPINLLLALKVLLSNLGDSLVSENMTTNASKSNEPTQLQAL